VVPLGVSLVLAGPGRPRRLPRVLLVLGWVLVGWVAAAPRGLTDETRRLPNGADVELEWSWYEHLVASVTAVVGVAFLVAAIVTALRVTRAPTNAAPPAGRGSVRGSEGPDDPRLLPRSISAGSRPPGS
jgi:alpha-1,2-mannosyltransferase